ncbi:MAG: class I SAM-dependent methyltransferase [Acaryochloridaceae cyanobacterium SU_2_1]|nr:class I SAM-dependent methyltransferase [Acaryochloridaceae cyanobacterium SU_2_1]
MVLQPHQRSKLDPTNDQRFYEVPRFVTHVDDGFIEQLTRLYGQYLQPNSHILDLMSSWVSHLPSDLEFARVVGQGLNAEELAKNPRLDEYFVQDLNQDLVLPFQDQSFDAVLMAVSVQYLQYPEAIFREIHRLLKPQAVVIISFSNRMFYQKAIQAWREGTEAERVTLVESYLKSVPGFSAPETIVNPMIRSAPLLPWLGWGSGDPFYAIAARRVTETPGTNAE